VMAAVLGQRLELTAPGTAERLRRALALYGLPVETGEPFDLNLMLGDKKRGGDRLNLILLREIGTAFIHPIALPEVERLLT